MVIEVVAFLIMVVEYYVCGNVEDIESVRVVEKSVDVVQQVVFEVATVMNMPFVVVVLGDDEQVDEDDADD